MTEQTFEIVSWLTRKVIATVVAESLKAGIRKLIDQSANLTYADLRYADLTYADLRYADLTYADLRYADLTYANLTSAQNLRLPTGELFSEYLTESLPALLTAGGQSLESFENHWKCHDWDNCPMAHAFGVKSEDATPLLLRPRVTQFVQLFDGKQLPWEVVQAAIDAKAKVQL